MLVQLSLDGFRVAHQYQFGVRLAQRLNGSLNRFHRGKVAAHGIHGHSDGRGPFSSVSLHIGPSYPDPRTGREGQKV